MPGQFAGHTIVPGQGNFNAQYIGLFVLSPPNEQMSDFNPSLTKFSTFIWKYSSYYVKILYL